MELILYYITLFVVSLLSTWWIFKRVLRIAKLKNIVDNPDARKLQRVPVPVLGGVAVFFGMSVALAAAGMIHDVSNLFAMVCAMVIMLYVGTMDDIIGLTPKIRFIIEIIVVLLLVYCNNYSIDNFHGLWGIYAIPKWIAIPLTVFACVGIINAINLIDGVNGLSSGYCIVTCLIFGFAFIITGDVSRASLAILAIGALIPFFFHNVFGRTSKMFIGDGGTLVMGIVMSIFVLNMLKTDTYCALYESWGMGLVPLSLAVLSIPVFDTIRVMSMRILRGVSPFHPDKTHLHHLFISMGFSHIGATISILLCNLGNILVWYLSYKLGASVDWQLYIVILASFLSTFGLYGTMRVAQRRRWPLWTFMCRMGRISHIERKGLFLWLQKVMDWKIN